MERIEAVPQEALDPQDRITLAILRWDAERRIELAPYYWLTFPYTPYLAGFSLNFVHQQLAVHPFDDPEQHPENYLMVLGEYATSIEQLDRHIAGQIERGLFLSRHALPGTLATLGAFATAAPQLMRVAEERLGALDDESRASFRESVDAVVTQSIEPAYASLLDRLGSDSYREQAPDAVGLAHYPDGEAYYRALVRLHTTDMIEPEALHQLGLDRVAEIEARMAGIRAEVGFEGTQAEFHQHLRTDPAFFAESPDEVEATRGRGRRRRQCGRRRRPRGGGRRRRPA